MASEIKACNIHEACYSSPETGGTFGLQENTNAQWVLSFTTWQSPCKQNTFLNSFYFHCIEHQALLGADAHLPQTLN